MESPSEVVAKVVGKVGVMWEMEEMEEVADREYALAGGVER